MANEEHLARLKQGVEAWNAWRKENPAILPDLREAHLGGADLHRVDLREADLAGADLHSGDLHEADLHKADLREADLTWAVLSGAHLGGAALLGAHLHRATLHKADFTRAHIGMTIFAEVDLSTAQGLEMVQHHGPSTIGIDTLYRSHGNIPKVFLQGAGVPEDVITYIKSLVGRPFEFYSCFISYNHTDKL